MSEILDISKYPNLFDDPLLSRWNLTNKKIINMTCGYDIESIYKNDPYLSNGEYFNVSSNIYEKKTIPPYYIPFWDHLCKTGRIESVDTFWDIYYNYVGEYSIKYYDDENNLMIKRKDYQKFFKKYSGCDNVKLMKAKYILDYASLVRDVNCYCLLNENLIDFKVIYNNDLDHKEGIDLLLIKNNSNKYIGLNLHTNTKRAVEKSFDKIARHIVYDNVIKLNLIFNIDFSNNDIQLYGEDDLRYLKTELHKIM